MSAFPNDISCSWAATSTQHEKVILEHMAGMYLPTLC
jgi:hypothetical protein